MPGQRVNKKEKGGTFIRKTRHGVIAFGGLGSIQRTIWRPFLRKKRVYLPGKPACSTQAGNVIGQCTDLAVIELDGDLVHLQTVLAGSVTEGCQLRGGVLGMLARQAGVL
jgi:hypothetical protein